MNQNKQEKHTENISYDTYIRFCKQFSEKKLFISQKEKDSIDFLTGKVLESKVKAVGNILMEELKSQDKAIVLFPQGLDYIYSMIACWHTNVVSIPAPIAHTQLAEQDIEKIIFLLRESEATYIITNTCFKDFLKEKQVFDKIRILNVDELSSTTLEEDMERVHSSEDTALLLYTSGSTSQPKGIVISHSNLMLRAASAATQWEIKENSCIVSWMPQFHSFGLLMNILVPLVKGASSIIMKPDIFLKNPQDWLRMIDKYDATHTAAPNFAFDYCCSYIDINSVKEISLRSLKAVICGGEPVCKETYESFTEKFKELGLEKNVFCPHYGLSEIVVATKKPGRQLNFLSLDISSLEHGEIKHVKGKGKSKSKLVASCGELGEGMRAMTVNPENGKLCKPDEVGEIWIKAPSMEVGYLKQGERIESAFSGVLRDTDEGGFLRTGDLGFIEDNQIYIVGREKDVIIINGKNHHAVDIEWSIKKNIQSLALPTVAFSYELEGKEQVVVVQEIEPTLNEKECKEIVNKMLAVVSETHEVEIYEIDLVESGSIPKTGSGKVQRKTCRSAFVDQQLSVLYKYRNGDNFLRDKPSKIPSQVNNGVLEALKKEVFLTIPGIGADRLEEASTLSELGLDSIKYVQISKKIEEVFKIQFGAVMLFKYRSFEKLAQYISSQIEEPLDKATSQGEIQRENSNNNGKQDIAIIGISCNLPGGAVDLNSFWENLVNGKDCITPVSQSRIGILEDFRNYYENLNATFPQWGGFIEDVDKFDAPFFGISPLEAESMDPQQRKLLELTWSVIEDSGYNPQSFADKNVGLFIGVHNNDYAELISRQPELMDTYGAFLDSGLHMSLITHRTSRWFDFHGPSEVINTACSSSLIALHHAVQSICSGDSSMAIAGGINIILGSRIYCASHKAGMLSREGHCKTFDRSADGFVRAEGYGAVLLKPYSQAVKDKDTIYGIIKGIAINHDGKSNSLRAPNLNAQRQLIKTAYEQSGVDPLTVGYIETHGTGTPLGDPIEFQALAEAFKEVDPCIPNAFCGIGAVKTNIGHCESATGIAGLIKLLLSMKHGILPGILHFKELNPNISLENTPFYIVQKNQAWKRFKDASGKDVPYRAGISSFGFGGANAHLILEEHVEANTMKRAAEKAKKVIVPISAKNTEILNKHIAQLNAFLKPRMEEGRKPTLDLLDVAYTLQVGRSDMEERVVFVVKDIKELVEKLDAFLKGTENIENCWRGRVKQGKALVALEQTGKPLVKIRPHLIAKHWSEGGIIDWEQFYQKGECHRVNLPTYPFAKIRYWIPQVQATSGVYRKVIDKEDSGGVDIGIVQRKMCFLKKQWELSSLIYDNKQTRSVVIFATNETRGLAKQLSEHFDNSQILYVDEPIAQSNRQAFKDYGGCIDLAGCGMDLIKGMNWIAWLQELIEEGAKDSLTLLCVTKGLECYENIEINLSGASRVGLYRMLQGEYSHLKSRHMDSDLSISDEALAEKIVHEFFAESDDIEICYREEKRYRAVLEEVEHDKESGNGFVFPEGQVLWITGGTRGLGYLCARHFVKHYGVKRLVLTGREILPPRDEWKAYENQTGSVPQKIRAVRELEGMGADVQVLSVLLTDENAMQKSVQEIKKKVGTIGGVIHCAGFDNSENPAFIRKSIDEIEKVIAPKVEGLDVLYKCLKDEPLRLFVMFSSVSAVIPALAAGHSDYAMANAYMDYFAEAKGKVCPMISIQWPNWKETGMGEVKNKAYENTGLLSHTDFEGLQLMDDILSREHDSVVFPAVVNPNTWKPSQLMQRTIQGMSTISTQLAEKMNVPEKVEALEDVMRTWLIGLFSKELRMECSEIEIDKPLQDYGVDSILLTQLSRKINQLVAEDLDPSILYEYPSIRLMAKWLVKAYGSKVSKALGAEKSMDLKTEEKRGSALESYSASKGKEFTSVPKMKTKEYKDLGPHDIAVVGMSCRFPGATTLDEYWELLSHGRCVINSIPKERWGYSNDFYAGLLDNITHFDPKFFFIPKEDARAMDPQALLILEESLKLFFNAGYSHQDMKGKSIGVYIGARSEHQPSEASLSKARNPVVAMGQNYLAANISQFFDLRGPSLVIDTACSSALVGMNMAVQALNSGEIEAAVVGGVSLLNNDRSHRIFEKRGILNRERQFHIFDKRSGGVVLGEGAGIILLKTLPRAIEDGDEVYAVIKGIAINNDGRTAGPATPNLQAQKEVLERALLKSGRNVEEISYIEANGSGTEVTDLLELKAIQSVYRAHCNSPLGVGSMKPNIGHPLCAEGIASFIKVVLMLANKGLVPFLSGEQPMTHYDIEASPFYFSRELTAWETMPRIAAINCFADGGTNAHVIVEAFENPQPHSLVRRPMQEPALNRYDVYSDEVNLLQPQKQADLISAPSWWSQAAGVNR